MSHYKDMTVAASIMQPIEVTAPPPADDTWLVSPKLNGVFARWEPGRGLYSKRGILFQRNLIPHIYAALAPAQLQLDGELWNAAMLLGDLTGALSHERDAPAPYAHKIEFVIFDVVLSYVPYYRRLDRAIEAHVFGATNIIPRHPHTDSTDQRVFLGDTYDGLVYHKRNGIYTPGRNNAVQKLKSWKDMEVDVHGVVRGNGLLRTAVGSLECRTAGGITFYVGSGFTHDQRLALVDHVPKRIKVRYIGLSSDGVPLNPTFIGLDL